MSDLDELLKQSMGLEAAVTQAIRTSKRTKNFKEYLDLLNIAYKQAATLSDTLKLAGRIAEATETVEIDIVVK